MKFTCTRRPFRCHILEQLNFLLLLPVQDLETSTSEAPSLAYHSLILVCRM